MVVWWLVPVDLLAFKFANDWWLGLLYRFGYLLWVCYLCSWVLWVSLRWLVGFNFALGIGICFVLVIMIAVIYCRLDASVLFELGMLAWLVWFVWFVVAWTKVLGCYMFLCVSLFVWFGCVGLCLFINLLMLDLGTGLCDWISYGHLYVFALIYLV